jgi:hypothetical protein
MKNSFGGAIEVVLLGIYVHLLRVAYQLVDKCGNLPGGCTPEQLAAGFNDVMSQALAVIGGLVSALVIAELAVTAPGQVPAARVLTADATPLARTILKWVTIAYVFVWLLAGLAAFLKGMYHPKVLPAFTSLGQAWLGLAVAAAYAYFNLKPGDGPGTRARG